MMFDSVLRPSKYIHNMFISVLYVYAYNIRISVLYEYNGKINHVINRLMDQLACNNNGFENNRLTIPVVGQLIH